MVNILSVFVLLLFLYNKGFLWYLKYATGKIWVERNYWRRTGSTVITGGKDHGELRIVVKNPIILIFRCMCISWWKEREVETCYVCVTGKPVSSVYTTSHHLKTLTHTPLRFLLNPHYFFSKSSVFCAGMPRSWLKFSQSWKIRNMLRNTDSLPSECPSPSGRIMSLQCN